MRWSIHWTLGLSLALSVISPSPSAGAEAGGAPMRPVAGVVSSVNAAGDVLYVGPIRFHVPESVNDLTEVAEGAHATVHFVRSSGQNVATSLEINPEPL